MVRRTATQHRGPRRGGSGSQKRPAPAVSELSGVAALVGLGLLAFAVTLQVSIAGVFRASNPVLVAKVAPFDAGARSRLAVGLVEFPETRQRAADLARDAIWRSPAEPIALRVLGQVADSESPADRSSALALIRQAERLSRRDYTTQMWLADHAARDGKPEAMLGHIDVLLRSSNSARRAAFPLLISAAADPRTRSIVLQTLEKEPNWAMAFARYAIAEGSDLTFARELADLLIDTRRADDRELYRVLMGRMVQASQFDDAWNLYRTVSHKGDGAGNAAVRNGSFEQSEDGSPFDWSFAQEPELWSAREHQPDRGGNVLRVAAFNGRAGEVARQLLHLPPGTHQLRASMGDLPANRAEAPEISLGCAPPDEQTLLRLAPARGDAASLDLMGNFVVPTGCTFQWLTIKASGEGQQTDPLPWVDDLRVQ